MNIYRPQVVKALELFYGDLFFKLEHYLNIYEHLEALSKRMWEGVQIENNAIFIEINNYHPNYLGHPIEALKNQNLTEEDCKHTIANQYGFGDWGTVMELSVPYNQTFETAVNDLLAGNITALNQKITASPDLLTMRSQYGHRATLLHYAGNNGVELWRQKIPSNLPEIIQFLLQEGADKNATMPIYGGAFTTLELVSTSAHPHDANCMDALKKALSN